MVKCAFPTPNIELKTDITSLQAGLKDTQVPTSNYHRYPLHFFIQSNTALFHVSSRRLVNLLGVYTSDLSLSLYYKALCYLVYTILDLAYASSVCTKQVHLVLGGFGIV